MQQPKPSKTCEYCGKVFFKKPSNSTFNWENRIKYCSRQCYGNAKRHTPPDSELKPLLYDLYWNQEMSVRHIAEKLGTHTESLREHFVRLGIPQRDRKEFAALMPQCQKRPLAKCEHPECSNLVKAHGRRFCSPKCRYDWIRGERMHGYLGPEGPWRSQMAFYTSAFWLKRAEEIRQRDKVCQRCGKTPEQNGKALDVHHIVPRRISQDDSHSNLVALCTTCHALAENEAGPVKKRYK